MNKDFRFAIKTLSCLRSSINICGSLNNALAIRKAWINNNPEDFPPITVRVIDQEYSLIDGHSRTYVAYENGETDILAEIYPIEEIEGPTKLYIYIHNKAKEAHFISINKLKKRMLDAEEHKKLWVKYCEEIERRLGL